MCEIKMEKGGHEECRVQKTPKSIASQDEEGEDGGKEKRMRRMMNINPQNHPSYLFSLT